MTKPLPIPPPGFDELSVDEKISYVQSLWDRIAADPEKVPVPDWHREVVNERLRSPQGKSRPWGEVREDIERKLRDRKG